eukprot:7770873-Ditylum_brightwellii.AAC.1
MTMMRSKFYLFIVVIICVHKAVSSCPNLCSGHGSCDNGSACSCENNWGAPDCSRRTCAVAVSWGSKPFSTSSGHDELECAGVGICNDETGECTCPIGFTGQACERMSCPYNCNGHGSCMTLKNTGLVYSTAAEYTNWDHSSSTMCVCDHGYTGPDCSYRICPKGDDPLTTGQVYRQFSITTGGDSGTALDGFFKFTLLGETFRFPANGVTWTSTACEEAFENLDNIDDVDCAQSNLDSADVLSATYTVTLKSFPIIPHENNIFFHDGNPGLGDITCDINGITQGSNPSCVIADVVNTNIIGE